MAQDLYALTATQARNLDRDHQRLDELTARVDRLQRQDGRNFQVIRYTGDGTDADEETGFFPGEVFWRPSEDSSFAVADCWIDFPEGVPAALPMIGVQTGYYTPDEEDELPVFLVFGADRESLFRARLTGRRTPPGVTIPIYSYIRLNRIPHYPYTYLTGGSGSIGAEVIVENTVEANGIDVSDEWTVTVSNATGCTVCLTIDGNEFCLPYDADNSDWDAEVGAGITVTGSLVFTFDGDFDAHAVSWTSPKRLCPPPDGPAVDLNDARIVTDDDSTGRIVYMRSVYDGDLDVTLEKLTTGNEVDESTSYEVTITDAAGGTLTPVVDEDEKDPFNPYDPAAAIEAAFDTPAVTITGLTESADEVSPKTITFTVTFDDFDDHTLTLVEDLTKIRLYDFDGGPDYDLCHQRWAHAEEITGYVEDPDFDQVHRVGSDGCGYLDTPADCDP